MATALASERRNVEVSACAMFGRTTKPTAAAVERRARRSERSARGETRDMGPPPIRDDDPAEMTGHHRYVGSAAMDCTHTRDLDGSDVVRGVWVMTVSTDRIDGRWDASEDHGATWRKDFDLIFERTV